MSGSHYQLAKTHASSNPPLYPLSLYKKNYVTYYVGERSYGVTKRQSVTVLYTIS